MKIQPKLFAQTIIDRERALSKSLLCNLSISHIQSHRLSIRLHCTNNIYIRYIGSLVVVRLYSPIDSLTYEKMSLTWDRFAIFFLSTTRKQRRSRYDSLLPQVLTCLIALWDSSSFWTGKQRETNIGQSKYFSMGTFANNNLNPISTLRRIKGRRESEIYVHTS